MLQASEYQLGEYLRWYHNTKNFSHVEYRKQLVKTPKVIILLIKAWAIVFLLLGLSVWLRSTWSIIIVLLLPYLLAYLMIIPVVLLKILVQRPAEIILMNRARKIFQAHPAIKIAVAGSFGKTTMREILKTIIAEGKTVMAPPHSYNTPLGICQFAKTLRGDEEVIIFELGESHPGDVKKLCELTFPQFGLITGINEAHLEKFKTLEKTTKTIFELADYLGDQPLYVNGESKLAKAHAEPNQILYSRLAVADFVITKPTTDLSGTTFTLTSDKIKLNLKSKLLGLHQIGPLAAACHLALKLGLTPEQVTTGVSKTKPFDHRLEPKIDASGVVTLDDSYNGNPDGVRAVIEFLSSLHSGRRFYVTPGLVEIGKTTQQVHESIGQSLAEAEIEKVILIKNSVTPFIEAGLKKGGFKGEIIWFQDALTAFATLPHLTVKGDIVLLQNDWPDQYR